MSFVNELRNQSISFAFKVGIPMLIVGIILLFFNSSVGYFLVIPALLILASGLKSFLTISIIDGTTRLFGFISRHAEPKWNGELLHTEGGAHKIRYKFGHDGSPRFMAKDVCVAIGSNPPLKNTIKWGGASLVIDDGELFFSREAVQEFLSPQVLHNHEARKLLVKLRNEVFRKLDKKLEGAAMITPKDEDEKIPR